MLQNMLNHYAAYEFDSFRLKLVIVAHAAGIKFFLENPACAAKPNAAETWLLLRASGTEPLLRVYCESCSMDLVQQILEQARQFVLAGRA